MDIYTMMAYYVAEKLKLRPQSVLEWSTPELIVSFGKYANEESYKSYMEWKSLDAKTRAKHKAPQKYFVRFYGDVDG